LTPEQHLSRLTPMIATPCYGGLMYETYVRGLLSTITAASDIGMKIVMGTVINESLITRARNELVKYFLMSNATHLFFIDADISFTPDDFFRLLLHDKDVVVGAYPLKGLKWEAALELPSGSTVRDYQKAVVKYAVNAKFPDEEHEKAGQLPIVDGLIEVHDAGTGFMCIRRGVIERMIEAYPEIRNVKEAGHLINEQDDGFRWAIFDTFIDEDERYLSEDYAFCRRWQRLGGKVWMDPTIELAHMGTYRFEGRRFVEPGGQDGLLRG
jgi:hypothetical protein